jgi:hypothetical protein
MSYIRCLPSTCSQYPTLSGIMPLTILFRLVLLGIASVGSMVSLRLDKTSGRFPVFIYVSLQSFSLSSLGDI